MTETAFGDRKPSEKELEDLILIAVAKREQMVAHEKLNPLETPRGSLAFTGNVRSMARSEGWRCDIGEVDAAVHPTRSQVCVEANVSDWNRPLLPRRFDDCA